MYIHQFPKPTNRLGAETYVSRNNLFITMGADSIGSTEKPR